MKNLEDNWKMEKSEELKKSIEEDVCAGYESFVSSGKKRLGFKPSAKPKIGFKPSAEQIEIFSYLLTRYKDQEGFVGYAPAYLNALMQKTTDKSLVLNLRDLSDSGVRLSFLGKDLEGKKLTIIGDVGDCLGANALNCEIHVEGGAGQNVGFGSKDSAIYVGSLESISAELGEGTAIYKGNGSEEYKNDK